MRIIIEHMSDQTDKVMTSDIQAVFASLQSEAVNALSDASSADDFFELNAIRKKLTDALDGSINQASDQFSDQNILNAITSLFEYIQTETNLPDPVRQILIRLYLPYLKVALIDPGLFNNDQHPARVLLELLHASSIGWVYEDEQSGKGFFYHLSSFITYILKNFREDIGLFEEACRQFEKLIQDEARQIETNESQVVEIMQGKENMRLAQVYVARIINTKVRDEKLLPTVVTDLLKDGWKDVLTLAYFRQGPDSEKFHRLTGLMDKLLWSVRIKNAAEERQALMKTIPDLLRDLRDELVDISYDEHKLAVLLKQLQFTHIHALKGDVQTDKPVAELIPTPLLTDPDNKHQRLTAVEEKVLNLQAGDWIKWQVASGRTVQGRLLWKSDESGFMVFVSRIGTKLAELMQKDLANLIDSGKVELLTDINQPVFDFALKLSSSLHVS